MKLINILTIAIIGVTLYGFEAYGMDKKAAAESGAAISKLTVPGQSVHGSFFSKLAQRKQNLGASSRSPLALPSNNNRLGLFESNSIQQFAIIAQNSNKSGANNNASNAVNASAEANNVSIVLPSNLSEDVNAAEIIGAKAEYKKSTQANINLSKLASTNNQSRINALSNLDSDLYDEDELD